LPNAFATLFDAATAVVSELLFIKMTQVELAAALGMDQLLLSRYERGALRLHGALVANFARVLQVTADEILGVTTSKAAGPLAERRRRPPHPGHRAAAAPQERDPALDHRLVPARRHREPLTGARPRLW
jgi:transcriptional regulator with XRE-family HTH domain